MEISHHTKKYWTETDWRDLLKAETISDLFNIAMRIIDRMPQGNIVQVCGPIGTGGLGSVEANLAYFNEAIFKLQESGLNVFDQMPFEDPMQLMKEKYSQGEYMESILTDFYLPLFKSGKVSTFYFLPDWQSSKGATWEHSLAQELGIEIRYIN